MTITKESIIKKIGQNTDHNLEQSRAIYEKLLNIISRNLSQGEDLLITGFGKFRVINKKERTGRNPVTQEQLKFNARKVVTFRTSGRLRQKIKDSLLNTI